MRFIILLVVVYFLTGYIHAQNWVEKNPNTEKLVKSWIDSTEHFLPLLYLRYVQETLNKDTVLQMDIYNIDGKTVKRRTTEKKDSGYVSTMPISYHPSLTMEQFILSLIDEPDPFIEIKDDLNEQLKTGFRGVYWLMGIIAMAMSIGAYMLGRIRK